MSRYRVGAMYYLWRGEDYVVQKKHWWGWDTVAEYDCPEDAAALGRLLAKEGHTVEFHL